MINNNSNGLSMFMQRNFNNSMRTSQESLEKITTGKRVNRAADDVGAFHMSETIRSEQISRRMALRNIEKGLATIERADSGMGEVAQIISKLKELTIQSSSENYTDQDRAHMHTEFLETLESLDYVAKTANYDDINLLVSYNVDVGLLVDVSGSMTGEIANVKNSIGNFTSRVRSANIDLKLGLAKMGRDIFGDNVEKVADMDQADAVFDHQLNTMGINANAGMDPWSSLMNLASPDTDVSGNLDPDAFDWRTGTEGKEIVVITDTGLETAGGGHTEQTVTNAMNAEGITVHTIGGFYSAYEGNLRYDSRVSMGNITADTGGVFTVMDSLGTEVDAALDNIADNLIANYGGSADISIQAGIDRGDDNTLNIDVPVDFTSAALGLDSMGVDSTNEALAALDALEGALKTVLAGRAQAGALYNKLLKMYDNENSIMNSHESAGSKITDTDIAEETSKMTTASIRTNVGQASLSQARKISLDHIKNLLSS